ncbi:MAG: tetratricopeptide repeat protein [Alphaproteobacteria bacterium]
MFESIKTKLTSLSFSNTASNVWDSLDNFMQNFDTSNNSVRLLSLILITITFSLFIIMTLFIYIKSIISLIKEDNYNAKQKSDDSEEAEESERIEQTKKDEEKRSLEKTEQEQEKIEEENRKKDFETRAQLERQQKFEETKQREEIKRKEEETFNLNLKKEKEETLLKEENEKKKENKGQTIDLDWKKGRTISLESSLTDSLSPESFQYKQNKKDFNDLIGLIINMLGRGVNDLKIAQTIMFRSQGEVSEEQTLQIISSINEFITLCNKGKFQRLVAEKNLPTEGEALYNLAMGDNTYVLALLESLMESSVEQGNVAGNGVRKENLFRDVSDYSCIFGSIASINDVHLATGSFELAVELNPSNVVAWSRVADMYSRASSTNKAVWAYHKVIETASDELYPEQIANANKALSEYYYDQGNSLQAAKMYNSAKQFYDSIGINRSLDRQELDIIEIIESNQSETLEESISKLLKKSREY